ncbi:alpha-amylase family protein [Pseudomarimonas arenosa]|uniref:Alpha-amylase n=1 Tax=Pseudomarimonas arenosa TaxID=2774145 RepID=A0AAW3ZGQ9_9GAMM|nr:alpha-amylase family protein [Pseudomarimonas arenosa]MBD8524469.1 alpha-amylase family protein [Pseudomarimonas arenosa]
MQSHQATVFGTVLRSFFVVRSALLRTLALSALLCSSLAQADVILHAFNWRYSEVEARAQAIKDAGYKIVLVAPAYKASGSEWWARYQPQDYRLIHHSLGDTESFASMVSALELKGVLVYADVVPNHMANEAAQRSDLNYPGAAVLAQYASNPGYYNAQRLFGDLRYNFLGLNDFGPASCIQNYLDVWQVQNWRLCNGGGDAGLPDLIGNSWVISQQQQYLRALKGMGVKGFRIDAVKHMKLPHVNALFNAEIKAGMHVFGEVITSRGSGDEEYRLFLQPYLNQTDHAAYDFPLHGSLREAFRFGGSMSALVNPQAVGQALAGARAVTVTVTHDMPNNPGIFGWMILNPGDETLAYAYILGRDGGVPMVFSDHGESRPDLYGARWNDAFNRSDIRAMIRFHNAAQGTDMQVLSYSDCHLLFRRGSRGIVGINKCGSAVNSTINMNNSVLWWNTPYTDTLSGHVVNIKSSNYTFSLPARAARMWLRP